MNRPNWTYIGQIDCFGVMPDRRDAILHDAMKACWQDGGELQLAAAENLFDTDRYDLHCTLPETADALHELLRDLAPLLPPTHKPITLEGFDTANMQREDLILRGRQLYVRPYQWQACDPVALDGPVKDAGEDLPGLRAA